MALAVSLQGVVLGSQPAMGGEPIQSAVMESKVTVHSCKIAIANCLSKRHGKHTYTQTHTYRSLTLSAAVVYPDNKKCVCVCGCAYVGVCFLSFMKYKERAERRRCFMPLVLSSTDVKCTTRND